ncbi:MAG: DUF3572 family protein [Pseudomonadota bacterium]
MRRDAAEMLALDALAWLAEAEERIGPFLAETGLASDDIRRRAAEPEFLGFVLDHLLQDEARLLAFCAARDHAPEAPARARAALPGGADPHWT